MASLASTGSRENQLLCARPLATCPVSRPAWGHWGEPAVPEGCRRPEGRRRPEGCRRPAGYRRPRGAVGRGRRGTGATGEMGPPQGRGRGRQAREGPAGATAGRLEKGRPVPRHNDGKNAHSASEVRHSAGRSAAGRPPRWVPRGSTCTPFVGDEVVSHCRCVGRAPACAVVPSRRIGGIVEVRALGDGVERSAREVRRVGAEIIKCGIGEGNLAEVTLGQRLVGERTERGPQRSGGRGPARPATRHPPRRRPSPVLPSAMAETSGISRIPLEYWLETPRPACQLGRLNTTLKPPPAPHCSNGSPQEASWPYVEPTPRCAVVPPTAMACGLSAGSWVVRLVARTAAGVGPVVPRRHEGGAAARHQLREQAVELFGRGGVLAPSQAQVEHGVRVGLTALCRTTRRR